MGRPAVSLMVGQTTHKRFVPFERRFRYRLLMIDLDIDRLEEAGTASALFNIDRPGLFSFNTKDHGAKAAGPLRPWAETRFRDAGIEPDGCTIRLLTFPRHAFYKFAPISVWRAIDPDGAPRGVIYEVNNTFGERHCYVSALSAADGGRHQHGSDKQFHVSPFFGVDGRYQFTLRTGDPDKFSLIVDTRIDGDRSHIATMQANAHALTTAALAKAAVRQPLSTLGVTAAIHWEALWIWRRGARYHRKPVPPATPATIARPLPSDLVYKE